MLIDIIIGGKEHCQLAIITKEDRSTTEFGIGAPFLKSFMTILDYEKYRVAFAV